MTQQKNPPKFGELQGPNKTRRENNERAKPEDQKPEAFEARSFISKRIVRGLSGLRYLPRQVCRGSTHRELKVSTTQSASKKSCQPNRQAAFRFFLQSLRVNDGGKTFRVKGSGKRLEVVRGASRDGTLK